MTSEDSVKIAPVTPDRWDDLVELFERKGPRGGTPMPGNCWCMWWRKRSGNAATNKRALRALVQAGRASGLLAYDSGLPVGWVSVGPREDYGQLIRSRAYGPRDEEEGVWSIVCFYVDRAAKGRGVAQGLLEAAVEHAQRRGASAVEAYPNRRPDYMGNQRHFEALGFKPARTAGPRTIMRRER